MLTELLPLDERRRITRLVHIAYFVQILQDQAMIDAFARRPAPEELVAMLLRQVWDKNHDPQPGHTLRQARGLVAIAEGTADTILSEHPDDNEAHAVRVAQLDLLLNHDLSHRPSDLAVAVEERRPAFPNSAEIHHAWNRI